MNEVFIIGLFFIVGAIFGSFLNVVIYRIPEKKSISFPPSHCMECTHRLHIRDLVPIFSYIFLKGKCRYCNAHISIQYPLVELISALTFTIIYLFFGLQVETFILCITSLFLLSIAVIDFKHCIIPNKILLVFFPFALLVAILHMRRPLFLYASNDVFDPLFGALIGSGLLFLVALMGYMMYRKKEVMGLGDVKFLIVIGLLLGFQNTLKLLGISVIIAAIAAILLILSKKKTRKDMMAFGPFLVLSFYIVVWISSMAYPVTHFYL